MVDKRTHSTGPLITSVTTGEHSAHAMSTCHWRAAQASSCTGGCKTARMARLVFARHAMGAPTMLLKPDLRPAPLSTGAPRAAPTGRCRPTRGRRGPRRARPESPQPARRTRPQRAPMEVPYGALRPHSWSAWSLVGAPSASSAGAPRPAPAAPYGQPPRAPTEVAYGPLRPHSWSAWSLVGAPSASLPPSTPSATRCSTCGLMPAARQPA